MSENEGPALLEVVELSEGEVVLRRADSNAGSGEPLVSIRFSPEACSFLGGSAASLGRAMIGAGLQLVAQMQQQQAAQTDGDTDTPPTEEVEAGASATTPPPRTRLH